MAAYAALVSLMQTIDEIKNHPRPPISLDQHQLCSLTENLTFLQKTLEAYSKEEDELERRIADAAYAVEDVIESHIVDQIHAGSTSTYVENINSVNFYQDLERVIQDMDLIKKEVMEIVKEKNMGAQHRQLMSTNSSVSVGPVRPISMMQNNTMVDFGDILIDVMDKLTRKDCNLEIIPIVGMGGMEFLDGQCNILWNLRTLDGINPWKSSIAPARSDIWKMPQLRHVMVKRFELMDPPCGADDFVLENLQTLSSIRNFKCTEEVVERIPNIRKLKLYYDRDRVEKEGLHSFYLNNLSRLESLTSLYLSIAYRHSSSSPFDLSLPHSLKKLYLYGTKFLWEDITTKIGSLPLLEVLKLDCDSCIGPEWKTIEGQFCSLKFLQIGWCELKCWTTNKTHFPRLEHLVLKSLTNLEEIPLSIGDIPTLQSIQLEYCLKSVNASAERIKEEQLSYDNEDLQVLIEGMFP